MSNQQVSLSLRTNHTTDGHQPSTQCCQYTAPHTATTCNQSSVSQDESNDESSDERCADRQRCAICLEWITRFGCLQYCSHVFCDTCLTSWYQYCAQRQCPMCRVESHHMVTVDRCPRTDQERHRLFADAHRLSCASADKSQSSVARRLAKLVDDHFVAGVAVYVFVRFLLWFNHHLSVYYLVFSFLLAISVTAVTLVAVLALLNSVWLVSTHCTAALTLHSWWTYCEHSARTIRCRLRSLSLSKTN